MAVVHAQSSTGPSIRGLVARWDTSTSRKHPADDSGESSAAYMQSASSSRLTTGQMYHSTSASRPLSPTDAARALQRGRCGAVTDAGRSRDGLSCEDADRDGYG